jgi:hypothetical protein
MDRSAGELNFCEEFVRAHKVKKDLIEKMRDALDLGDMARVSYNYRISDEVKRVRTNTLDDVRKALEGISASGNFFGFRAYRGVLGAGKIAPSSSVTATGSTICVVEDRALDEELSVLMTELEYSISEEDDYIPQQVYLGQDENSYGAMYQQQHGLDAPSTYSTFDEVAVLERFFNTTEGRALTREQKEAMMRQAYLAQTSLGGGSSVMSDGADWEAVGFHSTGSNAPPVSTLPAQPLPGVCVCVCVCMRVCVCACSFSLSVYLSVCLFTTPTRALYVCLFVAGLTSTNLYLIYIIPLFRILFSRQASSWQ